MDLFAFSEWLRGELERQNMTQADLVQSSGLSVAQISRIINLKSEPSKDALIAIARALDLPPDEVFRAAGILPPTPPNTELDQRVLHYLHQLHPEDQERVMLYLEVLASRYKYDGKRP